MNNIFNLYADYYDLLYHDKNYILESNYIHDILKKQNINNNATILELGCGTGNHAIELQKYGYKIHGIDLSVDMIGIANSKSDIIDNKNIFLEVRDIRNISLNKKFKVILALFHVVSYINNNEELISLFKNLSNILDDDGVFIFDCWYGPGVLADMPKVRVKNVKNKKIEMFRIAEPQFQENNNVVDVNYTIFVNNLACNEISCFKEKHSMRYFFLPELEMMLEITGLKLIKQMEWITDNIPGFKTFTSTFVIRKI
jgi:SAM-dependent methyltransferase